MEFDIIKGIAIILVVLGHLIVVVDPSNQNILLKHIYDFIYIFHMPLFFFVSGHFYSVKRSIKSLLKRILVPYLFFSFPHIILHIYNMYWNENIIKNIQTELYFNIFEGGYYWYLIYLFVMIIFMHLLLKRLNGFVNDKKKLVKSPIFISVLYVLATYFFSNKELIQFLYNFQFFLLGVVFKEFKLISKTISVYQIIIALLMGFIFSIIYINNSICIFKVFGAFFILLFIVFSSKFMIKAKWLSYIGKNSLIIYLFDGYLIAIETNLFNNKFMLLPILVLINVIFPLMMKYFLDRNKIGKMMIGS